MLTTLLLSLSLNALPTEAPSLAMMKPVGESRLKVLWFPIYHARLYSDDGRYDGIEPPLLLDLTYLRDIDAEDLLEHTRSEWQRLALYESRDSEAWLASLAAIWPDVAEGDRLTLMVQPQHSTFYFNGEPIGTIAESRFGEQFLSIWLHPDSRYPKLRNALIGQR
ncbi:chalcone isomerase family protein [Ferrimonas balearica]|uniref:chalcone isomerase family protein n=1 Tax=Ferrimonas balearica TaxID=44012 RepID=UPI001C99542A|nr:chalcone isomerase family protein [Ferrimonas balearica]MBY5921774.1 chalcone isomerase family protein [Ferrimonas balearica]MBY5994886.1 chalcone isomerase family protein [Ferrimonas balearica]